MNIKEINIPHVAFLLVAAALLLDGALPKTEPENKPMLPAQAEKERLIHAQPPLASCLADKLPPALVETITKEHKTAWAKAATMADGINVCRLENDGSMARWVVGLEADAGAAKEFGSLARITTLEGQRPLVYALLNINPHDCGKALGSPIQYKVTDNLRALRIAPAFKS